MASVVSAQNPDYKLALSKSLLFFEGQRSGKLPPNQRLTWRKDSALRDGQEAGVDLTGGYYDAGDNVKYSFPMAFTATLLAWSIIEFGDGMAKGDEWINAAETLRWNTDFLLKATANLPNTVYAMVGNPYSDHVCWERPEDMDTPRPVYAVNTTHPGSEVAGEIAAALAAASIAFKTYDAAYSGRLLSKAKGIGQYEKEAQTFACAVLPESPTRTTKFTPGGLLFKTDGCNNQFVGALSLLALIYAKHLTQANQIITCGNTQFPPLKLVEFAKTQADYILGTNPMGMSYMAGYGPKFPQHVHHRGASLPSINTHPSFIACRDGFSYLNGPNPNMNELTGAIVGGPNDGTDYFHDDRRQSALTEPTTYANAAFVGVFAYFVDHN
ncbi:hypothetical protein ZIOFF_040770 [Zingiber officinale]|uniref:cellulase n=1 Tax=Zingiber officinale TaxID=94328 RepID=A0A8J5GG58_ZINOF|nr:hypothetical protein ZIOFF_040770 [Zingiber officinale]